VINAVLPITTHVSSINTLSGHSSSNGRIIVGDDEEEEEEDEDEEEEDDDKTLFNAVTYAACCDSAID